MTKTPLTVPGVLQRQRPARQDEEDDEEHDAFDAGSVELARMARIKAGRADALVSGDDMRAAENHRPGHVGSSAPEFAIDEIGDAAEEKPHGATAATISNRLRPGSCCGLANKIIAMVVPINPPWKDMPPFQTSMARIGLASTGSRS